MTLADFCGLLRQHAKEGEWYLQSSRQHTLKAIRCRDGGYGTCPIAFLTGKESWEFFPAGRQLGLSDADICALVDAADGTNLYDHELRAALLEAVALEGP